VAVVDPAVVVVGAVHVLVPERRVVEVWVRGDGERDDALGAAEADVTRRKRGREDVGEHGRPV
jgi:hypothetical protein